jgi:hypothetical protein
MSSEHKAKLRLETGRLILRPFTPEDAPAVSRLAGQREIAHTTISIPHPFSLQQAQEWIAGLAGQQKPAKRVALPRWRACFPDCHQAPGRSRHLHWRTQRLRPETERAGSILSRGILNPQGLLFCIQPPAGLHGRHPSRAVAQKSESSGTGRVRPACGRGHRSFSLSSCEDTDEGLFCGQCKGAAK